MPGNRSPRLWPMTSERRTKHWRLLGPWPSTGGSSGNGSHCGNTSGTLTPGEQALVGVRRPQQHAQRRGQVRQKRKRMARIDRQRRQHRKDIAMEVVGKRPSAGPHRGPTRPGGECRASPGPGGVHWSRRRPAVEHRQERFADADQLAIERSSVAERSRPRPSP